ncbi:Permuted papain-like amidase enzyme, YaeF/YiiX, C92 family [Rheinheimera pacifica]|uniref:Permuted papain-like amidase enzyme, YaeF/YiiX, C92 family n=1 Tax=Rheinheimera pacifica TaxID=173990 RepID=A0A1H6KP04_9GAMM|nr:YiiX/YebB-like N1pC/P60 family cysteine hydrolase [Rheinheimera pacifica]SEH77465.1 Permuted papain-like amidase enzyme, YaeF/YiiX, C92 family [Rheinheimera pacifica]
MYIFEMNLLKPGDIILTSQVGAISKAVRLSTFSKFSHAILYVGDGSFIHSDGQGVHSNNIQRLLFDNKKHAEVCRVLDGNYVDQAIMFARSQIGTSYSVKEAVRTRNPLYRGEKLNRQFCSRLVAQSYEYAGLRLVNNSDYCTPKDLQQSLHTSIVDGCLRIAEDHEVEFARSDSPIQRQTDITNYILKAVRELTRSDIQSFENLDQFVIDNQAYDAEITNIVVKSGYLTMFDYELKKNPWRYNGQLFLSLDIDGAYKKERAEFELESAEKQAQLYSHNYLMCQNVRGRFPLRYFEMKMDLYKKLIDFMNKRIEAAKYVIKNT